MRSVDESQSRVVRYSGTTEAITVQHDSQGKSLFSVRCTAMLHLNENGNGDICVADKAGEVIVVVSAYGQLRIEYPSNGGLSIDSDHNLVVGGVRDRTIRIIKYLK